MKLLLQVLFAQGWLWRDRFPDAFTKTKAEHHGLSAFLLQIFPIVVLAGSTGLLAFGEEEGLFVTPMAVIWVAWSLSSRGLSVEVSWKELRISLTWTLGFLFSISVFAMLAGTLIAAEWELLPLGFWLAVCFATGCLRGIQRSYLIFRYPAKYAWMVDDPKQPPKGLIAPYTDAIVETYWRLPRQILFPQKERHA